MLLICFIFDFSRRRGRGGVLIYDNNITLIHSVLALSSVLNLKTILISHLHILYLTYCNHLPYLSFILLPKHRGASFLNACILHRYFVQRRSMALETMNKAFTTPKGISPFPAVELVHLLAFEDEEQVGLLCLRYYQT